MILLHILFQLFIEPLVLLMEVLFRLSLLITGDDVALSIIPLSIAVNLLCLPLYLRADAIQRQNRELEQKMPDWDIVVAPNEATDLVQFLKAYA